MEVNTVVLTTLYLMKGRSAKVSRGGMAPNRRHQTLWSASKGTTSARILECRVLADMSVGVKENGVSYKM